MTTFLPSTSLSVPGRIYGVFDWLPHAEDLCPCSAPCAPCSRVVREQFHVKILHDLGWSTSDEGEGCPLWQHSHLHLRHSCQSQGRAAGSGCVARVAEERRAQRGHTACPPRTRHYLTPRYLMNKQMQLISFVGFVLEHRVLHGGGGFMTSKQASQFNKQGRVKN